MAAPQSSNATFAESSHKNVNSGIREPRTRRNRTQASCEPCRKSKARCSHDQPVCTRCRDRGESAQCWYHPAPMTGTGSHPARSGAASSKPSFETLRADKTTNPFSRTEDADGMIDRILKALGICLPLLEQLEASVREYLSLSTSVLAPAALILPALLPLGRIGQRLKDADNDLNVLRGISCDIHDFSSTAISIDPTLTAVQFPALYHNLHSMRIETIGLLCAIAGRAGGYELGGPAMTRKAFVSAMFQCSSICISVTRDISPAVSDTLVWLRHEHLQLTLNVHGDTSPQSWRCLNDLTTDVIAAGLNREASLTNGVPFFLAECRRKTFAACYKLDKVFATAYDRPPRLSRRFADCHLPLDLADDILLDPDTNIDSVRSTLTSDGWSLVGEYHNVTWLRLRYIFAVFREEVLEIAFWPASPEGSARLRKISHESRQVWDALPSHLQYSIAVWESDVPLPVSLTFLITRISYLQNHFLIYHILPRLEQTMSTEMLQVSAEILAILLDLGLARDRAHYLRHDFAYLLFAYGIPAAAVLAKALRSNFADPSIRWPQTRSQLIRSLSVFVTYLDSASPLLDTNRAVCQRAKETIYKILDEIIDGPRPTAGSAGRSLTSEQAPALDVHSDVRVSDETEASSLAAESEPMFLDTQPSISFLEGDALTHELFGQDFDLEQWLENTDGMLTGEWQMGT